MLVPGESTLKGSGEIVEKHGNESYSALVWRRLKRSWTGMAGLIMVGVLIFIALFADFLSPVDPKFTDVGYSSPEVISFADKDGGWTMFPRIYPMVEGAELDPITYQPLIGPDYDNPRYLGLFVKGAPYRLLWLIPAERHLFGAVDGKPVHFLGTDKFGRDVLSRALYGSRISLMIALTVVSIVTVVGTTVGMVSGYFGGRFDVWVQRFVELVLAFPQLPLYLALTSLIPVTAPTSVFLAFVILVMSALGWAQLSREVRGKTLALAGIDYVRASSDSRSSRR
ncbi:MAG: ABC-type transporter, integral rane subunit [Proteobacteria bacterium]|nr:ABC-type transporter, integral rane subunit [Pseudomonadota bacterium]